jgi:hypothetical protein
MQKTLVDRRFEAWCDTEHDADFAKKLHDDLNKVYFRVKGVDGEYHIPNSDTRIKSHPKLIELCEYQHPDIIITFEGVPFLSIEITNATPFSGANPVQRLPRAVKAAEMGIPNIELAPWISNPTPATARGVEARLHIMDIYKVPSLSILFEWNNYSSFMEQFNFRKLRIHKNIEILKSECLEVAKKYLALDKKIIADMKQFCKKSYGDNERTFNKVEIKEDYIKVNIDVTGKRRYEDTKTGWETKGTGLLDPYPGYILAYDFLLCRTGPKISDRKKKIVVHFRMLPRTVKSQKENPATWWIMRAKKSKGYIYWNLLEKFSNAIIFQGETVDDIKIL